MESYRHAGNGASDSSRYQQLPTRYDQPNVVAAEPLTTAIRNGPVQAGLSGIDYSSDTSSSDEQDYTDTCSSSECSSSSWSSGSVPEWESHIDSQGELFYVQFSSNLHSPTDPGKERQQPSNEERQEVLKKKKKNRLSRLLRRREGNKGAVATSQHPAGSDSPVYLPTEALCSPADDWSDWTSFTLELEVHPTPGVDSNSSSGRRSTKNLCEALLGFVPGVTQSVDWHGQVSLRQRVLVDKLVVGSPLHHVQPGDWLEKLNGQNVTHRDLNDILSSINSREIVELNFRRRPQPIGDNQEPGKTGVAPPHGLLLLSQENVTESSPEMADILYQNSSSSSGASATSSTGIDPLLKWRGAGVTLAHLMPQLTGSPPSCSTVVLDGLAVHLAYVVENTCLMLLAAPSTWCTSVELQMTAKQMGTLLRFQYGSIRKALTEARWADEIRRTVDSLFNSLQPAIKPSTDVHRASHRLSNYFITCGQWLPLPAETHLDVTLTLNQMEAIDYEDWDEEAISVQRSATITGSAVYCQGYLLATTLSGKTLEQVGTFLKWNQILEMSHRRRLSSLILWREVFPIDAIQRSFIAVVGSGHILVVALLEGGGVAQPWDNYPDTFLIEEMQFFLEELDYLDLEATCNQILNGPQNPVLVTNLSETNDNRVTDVPTYSITPGLRPTLINFFSMDFGTGVFVAPTVLNAGTKFAEQFHKTALTIHKLFQQTMKSKTDLQRPDWGGPWSDKGLVALQEVSVLFHNSEPPASPSSSAKTSAKDNTCWVTGRLFTAPAHRELFVCYQDGIAQEILDLAFHLGFGALL